MAHVNVSNGVLAIIASFSNGLDVLKKLRTPRKRSKRSTSSDARKQKAEQVARLSRSLRRGPEEIGREYQIGSLRCDLEHYAVGDPTTQTSLAEIVFKMNTGLVGIIASFLSRDRKRQLELDYHSLTELSERSRMQTVDVLRQLCQRLTSRSLASHPVQAQGKTTKTRETTYHALTKKTKKWHPTLARVTIENSSIAPQVAMVRPSEPRKQRSTINSRSSSQTRKPDRKLLSTPSAPNLSAPPPSYSASPPKPHKPVLMPARRWPHDHAMNSTSELPISPEHKASIRCLSREIALSDSPTDFPPELKAQMFPASLPTSRDITDQGPQRLRPNTLYSTATARTGSTKLGEIPMHKWAEPWDFEVAETANREALACGWPVQTINESKEPKNNRWIRWFRKKA